MTRTMAWLAPGAIYLAFAGVLAAGIAILVPDRVLMWALFSASGTLLVVAAATWFAFAYHRTRRTRLHDLISQFIAQDASPSFTTDSDGEIGFQNRAAVERFGSRGGQVLSRALSELFADPAAVLRRLQLKAQALGAAREDLVTRRGHVRLSVHQVGAEGYLWRLEDMAERAIGGHGAETISLPMLTVSESGTILFLNEAMRRLIGERVRTLDRVFRDLPLRSGEMHEVATPAGPVRATIAQIEGPGGRSEIYLLPISAEQAQPQVGSFEILPIALMKLDTQGRVAAVNRAARGLMGKTTEGAHLSDLLEGLGRPVSDWVADALDGRADRRPEVLRARRGDKEVFLQVTLARIFEEGRAGLLAVLSDATQLKTLEAQFVQSQKMQAIGQLAGGVAHDFNNLLTAIAGHCDLLMLRHDKGDPDFADLDQISQNTNRAASLVGQLLAFSRKQTLKPQMIDLRDTVSEMTHLLNRLVGEKVSLTLSHDPELRPIRADKRQLEQVLMNLVVNARDAMPGGGEITITTENLHLVQDIPRDRVTVPKGDYVAIQVSDQGTGIAPEVTRKIFEPFFTTKRTGEGTGLGLSTAYGIIKQTGGYIFCDSVVGSGTCFTIYLPAFDRVIDVDADEPEPARELPVTREASSKPATVLLVEDEAPVRAFASRALKLQGFNVLEAENAEEALAMLEAPDLAVDIFVTDVIMPGLDGPSWVAQARESRPGIKTIFMSGYAEDVFKNGDSPIDNSVFLPKPFSLSELTATVQNQLG
ncbi:ATP-binding protein [Thioclava dalianensis]|nr:ATP-binding protein [Thioclava dalianensis]